MEIGNVFRQMYHDEDIWKLEMYSAKCITIICHMRHTAKDTRYLEKSTWIKKAITGLSALRQQAVVAIFRTGPLLKTGALARDVACHSRSHIFIREISIKLKHSYGMCECVNLHHVEVE